MERASSLESGQLDGRLARSFTLRDVAVMGGDESAPVRAFTQGNAAAVTLGCFSPPEEGRGFPSTGAATPNLRQGNEARVLPAGVSI